MSLFRNLNMGTILVDSCSSGQKPVEKAVVAENYCFTIEQDGQNITILQGSVFGYAYALGGRVGGALKSLFVSRDNLLVSLDADDDMVLDSISALPSEKRDPGSSQIARKVSLGVHLHHYF
ncbi:unnamed protein product [Wuchereria bancrofti]|uniref:Uncharacterized protein n=1 Tax=Wuchereria bancrofti TaxID=6293 RepID=A0A3P7GER2_WUCBA|nr:unnamed protein product [Wuchereria bancrofti]